MYGVYNLSPKMNGVKRFDRLRSQAENAYADLIKDQEIAIVPSFTLESGVTLKNVPVAYRTWGTLSASKENVMVICHALTGSSAVSDWWGPLLGGAGKAFDTTRFFVICMNSLGSPYGTASPVTNKDGDPSRGQYGPEFPLTTIRDDVALHKLLLDDLGVRQIAVVIGGSMGGMLALEWAYYGPGVVRAIVPIATSSQHSAWGISWGEAQRQSIYADPKYDDGYYSAKDPPETGLGAARMSALLTYRSRNSFESRFGRNPPDPSRQQNINGRSQRPPTSITNEHWAIHNDGHTPSRPCSRSTSSAALAQVNGMGAVDPQFSSSRTIQVSAPSGTSATEGKQPPNEFTVKEYLRYQKRKFVNRFDSNCYIAITRKLDTHDVSRHRVDPQSPTPVAEALAMIKQPALIIGIESDGLFTFAEQQELAAGIPNARLRTIDSPEGHDAFLLQFEQVNQHILEFLKEILPDIMETSPQRIRNGGEKNGGSEQGLSNGQLNGDDRVGRTKESLFGEAEATDAVDDITAW